MVEPPTPPAVPPDPLNPRPAREPRRARGHMAWLGGFVALLIVFAVIHVLLRLGLLGFAALYQPLLLRITAGVMAVLVLLVLARLIRAFAIERVDDAVTRYNLQHILRLVVYLVLAVIVVSVAFANWYAAFASLGLVSLILGFALQTPITSLIGWVYILARKPYRVGDRISIGEASGDVIEVTYLDTTLWEVGGPFVSRSHPSGRVIKFPNATVLNTAVFNFSWEMFPYIWDEISFQIAYDSDIDFVSRVMQQAATEELGESMIERVRTYREILARTPVDEVQVQERPSVLFRVNVNTWIEATVRYVVEPRKAGPVKTRLLTTMLERLNAEPERVRFPKGDNR